MSDLYRVLYCSRNRIARGDGVAAEIRGILEASRRNNARSSVTGGLLFNDNCFAQVLEGPLEAVESAFERIQCDERHSDVIVLESGPIPQRDFPDWAMAFAGTPDQDSSATGFSLSQVFADRSAASGNILDILKAVVAETIWLAPS